MVTVNCVYAHPRWGGKFLFTGECGNGFHFSNIENPMNVQKVVMTKDEVSELILIDNSRHRNAFLKYYSAAEAEGKD